MEHQVHRALYARTRTDQLAVQFSHLLCIAVAIRRGRADVSDRRSLATQSLVIFVIRTRGSPWRSLPHPLLTCLTIGAVLVGLLIPLPLGPLFGFVEPPARFYLFLVAAVGAYLLLVELVKRRLYR